MSSEDEEEEALKAIFLILGSLDTCRKLGMNATALMNKKMNTFSFFLCF
jgi:hypothetical protein